MSPHSASSSAVTAPAPADGNLSANVNPSRSSPTAKPLRLATWNLQWLSAETGTGVARRGNRDYARLSTYAERLDADIVAVQEVDGEEALARVFSPEVYSLHVTDGTERQRVGFAWKRALSVVPHADHDALALGPLRAAADVSVTFAGHTFRLLSVHLKSGCFEGSLESKAVACRKLYQQLPLLEVWIDERAREGVPFAVLGDFNRRFFARPMEVTWVALDDAEPLGAGLWSPTEGRQSRCWNSARPQFIDHLLFGDALRAFAREATFLELVYDDTDAPHRALLSDHCPLALTVELPERNDVALPSSKTETTPDTSELIPAASATPLGDQLVKGNVSRGRKRYHTPGCPNYDKVVIDPNKGERTFASEEEARAAGFSKAGNCP
jgi:endonuclease/exonuclease/phosphatase family metal-dependent hydrolase